MTPRKENPLQNLSPETRGDWLAAFLEGGFGDEEDFERLLRRGEATIDKLAARTSSEVEADEALAEKLFVAIFNDENTATSSDSA